jgi:hypothetical protein
MSVQINQVTPGEVLSVNGKVVRKNMDGNWISNQELNSAEEKFLNEYLVMSEIATAPVKATFEV